MMWNRLRSSLPALLPGATFLFLVACSPSQLAPMPLLTLATLVDSAQAEHAPETPIDWRGVVAAHDAYLDRWELWRHDGVALWALRPIDMEPLISGATDGAVGDPPAAFAPWSGLLRRSHGFDRRLHEDLQDRRTAHPAAVTAAMLRRRTESGVVSLAAEVNRPVAQSITDLRTWVRIATNGVISKDVADRLALHEREQTQLVEALEEAILHYLRHFTIESEWRGARAGDADDPAPIPRVAWDAIVRAVAVTDAMIRLQQDSIAGLLPRLDPEARRLLILIMMASINDIAPPEVEPDRDDATDRALAATALLLIDESADPLLRDQLHRTLDHESELALRAFLLLARLEMAELLQAQPRAASETIPSALRHLDSDLIRDELIPIQHQRQRNLRRIADEITHYFGAGRLDAFLDVAEDRLAERLSRHVDASLPDGGATGRWRTIPAPEPWRRTSPDAVEATPTSIPVAHEKRRLRSAMRLALRSGDEPAAELAINDAVEAERGAFLAAVASAAAWRDAGLAQADWPDPRAVDRVRMRIEINAIDAVARILGRPPNDPLLECIRLDWALARLDPDLAFGTSEARRDHATSPTLLIDERWGFELRRAVAAHVAPSVAQLVTSAEHMRSSLERVAAIAAQEQHADESSSDAWVKRLGSAPTIARGRTTQTPVSPRLRSAAIDAEIAIAEHATLVRSVVAHATESMPPALRPHSHPRWLQAAYPLAAIPEGVPDGVALLAIARAGRSDRAETEDAVERARHLPHLRELRDADIEHQERVAKWRRRTIDASRELKYIPLGPPDDDDLRRREAALWAHHRLAESYVRGALLALHHAEGGVVDAIRGALGWRIAATGEGVPDEAGAEAAVRGSIR